MHSRLVGATLIAILASCTTTHETLRITDEQVATLRQGMTIDEVRAEIGRPWHLEVHPFHAKRETHRYVMKRLLYEGQVMESELLNDPFSNYGFPRAAVMVDATLSQYRVLVLRYEDGKLSR